MNGVHDMGGMHGMGPIAPEADEPVFSRALGGPRFRAQPRSGRAREMEHRCRPARAGADRAGRLSAHELL